MFRLKNKISYASQLNNLFQLTISDLFFIIKVISMIKKAHLKTVLKDVLIYL